MNRGFVRRSILFCWLSILCSSCASSICREAEGSYCPLNCAPVVMSCSWGGYEVAREDCPTGCVARGELLMELCDAGVKEDISVVEEEMVCEEVESTSSS